MSSISAKLVKELRDRSGFGMMECKAALTEAGGDIDGAVEYLRKQKAAKIAAKASRDANEGLVAFAANDNGDKGIVHLCSETDFVAKGQEFQTLVADLANSFINADVNSAEDFLQFETPSGSKISEKINDAIGVIKENIKLTGAKKLLADANTVVGHYVHCLDRDMLTGLGKIAAIVKLKYTALDNGAGAGSDIVTNLQEIGKKLSMHIAAASPRSLNVTDLDQDFIAAEKEVFIGQAKESGKPDNIVEKMVEGKLRKLYEEVVLTEQNFLIEDAGKVSEWLNKQAKELGVTLEIVEFARFAV